MEAPRRRQIGPAPSRALAVAAVILAVALAASALVLISGDAHRSSRSSVSVGGPTGSRPALALASEHRRHRRHDDRPRRDQRGRDQPGSDQPGNPTDPKDLGRWLHDAAAPMPSGARPGHGYPTPMVLSPAEELADIGRLPAGWRASVHVLVVGGLTRNYLVIAPVLATIRTRSLPLYLALHGRGANPDTMEHITSLESDTGPAVIVYPSGYESSWNAGGCCGYAHADGVDDVAFLHDVVDRVLIDYPVVSASRVYAVGFSNGGRMTYRLACQLPGTFAGIAAVEAVPVIDCRHLHPLDVEIIAQRDDPLLSISDEAARKTMDGYLEPTVSSAVAQWRGLDGCSPTGTSRPLGDATQDTWDCRDDTRLQYTLYPGGAHKWPEGRPGRPPADRIILGLLAPDPRSAAL